MDARLPALARRVGDFATSRAGAVPIPLAELVSPLRYDILVRARYFEFLEANLALYHADFDEYFDRALELPYFTWFRQVALPRNRPAEAAEERLVLAAYADRLQRSTALLAAYRERGFDDRYPVLLRVAAPDALTGTGKRVERAFHAGDGCHRLALLLFDGRTTLPPEYYRVRRRPRKTLIDNTAMLISALGLSEAEYFGFLSLGYTNGTHEDAASLLASVSATRPDRLAELEAVIAADAAAFRRVADEAR